MLDAGKLIAIRNNLHVSQITMASRLGLSHRPLQNLESGATRIRRVHENALRSVLIEFAIERNDITLLGADQTALAGLILREFADRMGHSFEQRQEMNNVMQLAA